MVVMVLFAAAVVGRLREENGRALYKVAGTELPNALRIHLHYHCTDGEVLWVRYLGHVALSRLLEASVIAAGQRQPTVARGEEHLHIRTQHETRLTRATNRGVRLCAAAATTHVASLIAAVHIAEVAMQVGGRVDMIHRDVLPARARGPANGCAYDRKLQHESGQRDCARVHQHPHLSPPKTNKQTKPRGYTRSARSCPPAFGRVLAAVVRRVARIPQSRRSAIVAVCKSRARPAECPGQADGSLWQPAEAYRLHNGWTPPRGRRCRPQLGSLWASSDRGCLPE